MNGQHQNNGHFNAANPVTRKKSFRRIFAVHKAAAAG